MARYAGLVCYGKQVETEPGIWETEEKTLSMKGDMIRQNADIINSNSVNDDISLGHRVSLVGDAYAFENYFNIKWIEIDRRKWKVSSIEIQRPRIIVDVGGLWNGNTN